ncbi:30S ribosomal protein S7 [Candidatus Berkelbacteria bacterium CG10_big_fil_rev_8_21_14_0_10_43_13]|uniref:Small ribosomal subunit protein uS7 n=1 Tax=Candidatus Berkelbacteria bacterium CG10_big_fil_rev_8_21_14_0_10_43_13 TaxID=1974514 RepID=A0A2H0W6Q7_9BACT|nr:MAG: 30S ribosomal protein S7 [Candidatus Berkelbacteria bacterium CG10_big_fil_rev_8_21_14_0_10_43_13]
MARGHLKIKRKAIQPDAKFSSLVVTKMINYIMKNGKKTVAEKIVYQSLDQAALTLKAEPMEILDTVLKNVGPLVEVKSKRIGGANYQVPMEVSRDRKNTLAMRWVIGAAQGSKGKPMAQKLALEMISAYNNEGAAIKKKDDTHRMAEANKAFAHFARF